MAKAYYNEIDPYAAQWLRNLIRDGHIAPGDVDERSIEDVQPDDLRPYTQCHFFAGVGLWSYALRRRGWDDERPIWTGSCPCQPFSSAGKGVGFGDERHLWPAFAHLIAQCGPSAICGEQVASKDGYAWLDLVQTDMEGLGYAFWSPVLPIAGVGGPNERHRLWWVGLADAPRGHAAVDARPGTRPGDAPRAGSAGGPAGRREVGGLDDPQRIGWGAGGDRDNGRHDGFQPAAAGQGGGMADAENGDGRGQFEPGGTGRGGSGFAGGGEVGRLADAASERRGETGRADAHGGVAIVLADGGASLGSVGDAIGAGLEGHPGHEPRGGQPAIGAGTDGPATAAGLPVRLADAAGGFVPQPVGGPETRNGPPATGAIYRAHPVGTGPLNGFWRDADWLFCTDGKWRPVEPGTRPLAHGLPLSMGQVGPGLAGLCSVAGIAGDSLKRAKAYRVGTLKGYGNAISPEAAAEFIGAWMGAAA